MSYERERNVSKLKNLVIAVIIVLVITACGNQTPKSIYFDGNTYYPVDVNANVDRMKYEMKNGSISNDGAFYFHLEETGEGIEVSYAGKTYIVTGTWDDYRVLYPDENTYYQSTQISGSTRATSSSGSPEGYPEIDDFSVFIGSGTTSNSTTGDSPWFIGIMLIIIGTVGAINPRLSFYLNRGWRYRNAEPSDLYLGMAKVGGVAMCVVGFAVLITGFMA